MNLEFIARTKKKGALDVSAGIIEISTIKANETTIKDLQEVIELLQRLGYTIDG